MNVFDLDIKVILDKGTKLLYLVIFASWFSLLLSTTKGGRAFESLVLPPVYRLIISNDLYQRLNSFLWCISKRRLTPPTFFLPVLFTYSNLLESWKVFKIEQLALSNRYKL